MTTRSFLGYDKISITKLWQWKDEWRYLFFKDNFELGYNVQRPYVLNLIIYNRFGAYVKSKSYDN